jgi:hypothetical protein
MKPNVGIIKMYTSGCPKNQNRCCDKIGSPPYAYSKKVVLQCLSNIIIIIAAPRTGVMIANILRAKSVPIVENGSNTLLLRIPGIASVLLVTNRFVNETVVLTPAKITLIISISCAPIPVYFVHEEKGVMKVHPAVTSALFEHLVK